MKDKRKRFKCPSCQNTIKSKTEVVKCRTCFNYCCKSCLVNNECIDCYTKFMTSKEIEMYHHEKEYVYGVCH